MSSSPTGVELHPLRRSGCHPSLSTGPDCILKMAGGNHHAAAIKTALELDVFTAIAEGNTTAAQLSERCHASYHGIESLCNYMVAHQLLRKQHHQYELSEEARLYLDRRSEHFCGALVEYLALPELQNAWLQLISAVQYGGAPHRRSRSLQHLSTLHARATAKLRRPLAQRIASLVAASVPQGTGEPFRVLNAGASHGLFGLMIAAASPDAEVCLSDEAPVLEVARENAAHERLLSKVSFLPGDIFNIAPEKDFHVVIAAFFLSLFEPAEAMQVAYRLYEFLSPGGLLVIVDDIVDETRTSPMLAVSQNLNLLATTAGGQVYTISEMHQILQRAGFESVTAQAVSSGVSFLARKPRTSASSDVSAQETAARG